MLMNAAEDYCRALGLRFMDVSPPASNWLAFIANEDTLRLPLLPFQQKWSFFYPAISSLVQPRSDQQPQ